MQIFAKIHSDRRITYYYIQNSCKMWCHESIYSNCSSCRCSRCDSVGSICKGTCKSYHLHMQKMFHLDGSSWTSVNLSIISGIQESIFIVVFKWAFHQFFYGMWFPSCIWDWDWIWDWNFYTKRWSKVGSAKKPKSSAVTLSSFRPKSSVMYLKVQSTHLLGPF